MLQLVFSYVFPLRIKKILANLYLKLKRRQIFIRNLKKSLRIFFGFPMFAVGYAESDCFIQEVFEIHACFQRYVSKTFLFSELWIWAGFEKT